eukprot:scaffold25177_cov20-Tisochrysis_lutea.AAC.1
MTVVTGYYSWLLTEGVCHTLSAWRSAGAAAVHAGLAGLPNNPVCPAAAAAAAAAAGCDHGCACPVYIEAAQESHRVVWVCTLPLIPAKPVESTGRHHQSFYMDCVLTPHEGVMGHGHSIYWIRMSLHVLLFPSQAVDVINSLAEPGMYGRQ